MEYISPNQVNAIAPADTAAGAVQVQVTSNGQTSDSVSVNLQTFSPAFFSFDGKYVAAVHADSSLLGKAGLFASAPSSTTPAKPGETIVLYGSGFGPTTPVISGQITTGVAPIANPFTITVGGSPATVLFGGLVPPFAALYQFNVTIPASVADGDQPIVASIGGVSSPSNTSCCLITIQN